MGYGVGFSQFSPWYGLVVSVVFEFGVCDAGASGVQALGFGVQGSGFPGFGSGDLGFRGLGG